MAKRIIPSSGPLESAFFTEDLSSLDWRIRGDLERARRFMMYVDSDDLSQRPLLVREEHLQNHRGGLRVRIYSPENPPRSAPCLLCFHGGGFNGASLAHVDNPCRYLADRMDGVVVSADYALAPEHPFPAGLEDCERALRWVMENTAALGIDPGRIGLVGDSAGGNLAVCLALREVDQGRSDVSFLGLIYPVLDVTGCGPEISRYSPERYPVEDGPEKPVIRALYRQIADMEGEMRELYLPDMTKDRRYHSPLGEKELPVLPRTLLIAAEYDALRPQAECLYERLEANGTSAEYILYQGVGHAFMDKLGRCPQAADCLERIAAAMRAAAPTSNKKGASAYGKAL